jgi:dolichol-phosphate mannosyltransferase
LGGRSLFHVIIVLPAYNEEGNVGGLLKRIDRDLSHDSLPYRVVVVDDGSIDRTAEILADAARLLPVTVFRHERNQGLGAAIRDGLRIATEMAGEDDIIVTMDADETHSPAQIAGMIRRVEAGSDVVTASRFQPGAAVSGLTLHRRLISWAASLLMRVCFPTPGVRDYTCGFRAYRAAALRAASDKFGPALVDQAGFQCMADILLKLRRMDLVFGEVPMVLRYDVKRGVSKMKIGRTAAGTLRMLLKRRFVR